MINIICFYWQGERWQKKDKLTGGFKSHLKKVGKVSNSLASKYVNNLYYGVNKFTTNNFKFICFTNSNLDLDKNIEIRNFPLLTSKGVLPRLYMFSREAGLFGNQIFCLDIDIIITGSLKPFINYSGTFCSRNDFKKNGQLDGDIMSFYAGKETENIFWKPFIKNVKEAEQMTSGRESLWIRHVANDLADRWGNIAPGKIASYKRDIKKWGYIPEKTSIISFHGYPRPHQVNEKWINKYWE